MNWRALTDLLVWRLFRHEPDVCAGMRRLFNEQSAVRVIAAKPVASKFALQWDANGRWLTGRVWSKFRRVA